MFTVAQTITQFYRQLDPLGWRAQELEQVARSYDLAADLFAGMMHASGKMFMDHCIGTASVLVAIGKPAPIVAAGICHNAYQRGQFGDDTDQPTPAKRREVAACLGDEAESYVHEYRPAARLPHVVAARGAVIPAPPRGTTFAQAFHDPIASTPCRAPTPCVRASSDCSAWAACTCDSPRRTTAPGSRRCATSTPTCSSFP